jgi:hypothetical protein
VRILALQAEQTVISSLSEAYHEKVTKDPQIVTAGSHRPQLMASAPSKAKA